MAGGVNHVQRVGLPVHAPRHPHGLRLYRDATLAFDIHPVQILLAHLPRIDHSGELQHPVREGGFAVVNMRNDAEIAQAPSIG